MSGRHAAPPLGSAAREATASPYIGLRRWDALRRSVQTMRGNSANGSDVAFGLDLVLDEMKTIELAEPSAPRRACFLCGKVLMAEGGFIETTTQPDGTRRDFCSWRCIRDQLKDGVPL